MTDLIFEEQGKSENTLIAQERLKAGGEGDDRAWMVGWHHQLNGHGFEQTPGDSGQGSLACCSPWGHKESDITEWENNNNIFQTLSIFFQKCKLIYRRESIYLAHCHG